MEHLTESPILHVDMDAFFAAVEQRDNPLLKGKPVIVGGDLSRGVVSAASYEARAYGIRSAMPLREAQRLCQEAIFLRGDHEKYSKVSYLLMDILCSFAPLVEKVSIDEAFLDVSGCEGIYGSSLYIGEKIKETIREELQLTASVGVAPNKILAKIASDLDKPDGLVYVDPAKVESFLEGLEVDRLFGVGKKMAQFLRKKGIFTIGQLAAKDPLLLEVELGRQGRELHLLAQGIDPRPVLPHRAKEKSIGHEITFSEDIVEERPLKGALLHLSTKVSRRLRKGALKGRTLTLKVRCSNFATKTRSITFHHATSSPSFIYEQSLSLFLRAKEHSASYRLLGLSMSNLVEVSKEQLSLFQEKDEEREERLMAVIDDLQDRFGDAIIKKGGSLFLSTED